MKNSCGTLRTLTLVFLLSFFALGALAANTGQKPEDALSEAVLKRKIAQMIMVGFNGQSLSKDNPIYYDVKNLGVGGVILFNKNADKTHPDLQKNIKNPAQVKKLTQDLQEISAIPLFVAIDQEGGMVSRLDPAVFGVSAYSAKDLGQKNDLKLTYTEALKTAKALAGLGINVNLVPCVDLDINKTSPVIGKLKRSFSDNPHTVVKHSEQVISAHDKYGILTTLKHFPGHGSAAGDTHGGFVDVTQTFSEKELLPYKELISNKTAKGVLISHVFNTNMDKKYPASLSNDIVKGILQDKMKFDGLVFTDDIQMGAIKNNYTLEQTLYLAINAGSDVIIIGNNLYCDPHSAKKAVNIIYNLVKSGKIKPERIEQSYKKILSYKGVKN